MKYNGAIVIVLAIFAALSYFSLYTIDEKEQVVITRFGKVVGESISESGIQVKLPIDFVNRMPKTLLEWDGDRGEIPTKNKNYIWVNTFAVWEISKPVTFIRTCNGVRGGQNRLGDIINPAVKNAIASYDLIETVRNTNREFDKSLISEVGATGKSAGDEVEYKIEIGRSEVAKQVFENAKVKLEDFGIKLIDVKIKRVNYREDVRKSVYDRMKAERMQIVERFRSEGRGEAEKILGDKDKELKKITSEAYKKAEIIKGTADAEVTRLYADAYGRDPEFYSFVKSMEVYSKALDKNSSIILSTDSEFLKYINGRKK